MGGSDVAGDGEAPGVPTQRRGGLGTRWIDPPHRRGLGSSGLRGIPPRLLSPRAPFRPSGRGSRPSGSLRTRGDPRSLRERRDPRTLARRFLAGRLPKSVRVQTGARGAPSIPGPRSPGPCPANPPRTPHRSAEPDLAPAQTPGRKRSLPEGLGGFFLSDNISCFTRRPGTTQIEKSMNGRMPRGVRWVTAPWTSTS